MTPFKKLDRWLRFNLRYLEKPPWDTGVSPPELEAFLNDALPGNALDLGCGTGTNLWRMAQAGWSVTGVDLAWLPVWRARRKLRQVGVSGRVLCGGVTANLGLEGPYDLVLDIGCYHNLSREERQIYQKKVAYWLRGGGTFLLYAHQRREPRAAHGIDPHDLEGFARTLTLVWERSNGETRPDGCRGRLSTWARFDHPGSQ